MKLAAHPVEAALEAAAPAAWTGTGDAVALLDFDGGNSAPLLERIHPGTPLTVDHTADVVEVAADLLGRLHVPPPPTPDFPATIPPASGYATVSPSRNSLAARLDAST